MRDSARVYIGPFTRQDFHGNSYVTWDLVATNNSVLDNPGTGVASQRLSGLGRRVADLPVAVGDGDAG